MGESFGHWRMGNDEMVMPWVDMANIAWLSRSDPHVMSRTIDYAIQHDVQIGAHPGYPDLQGFGRRSMSFSEEQILRFLSIKLAH